MRIIVNHSSKGIALIIAMISILVLATLAGGFAYSMKIETKLARNANFETELEWLGRSGVEFACWVLAEQLRITAEPYDALNQKWAGGPGGGGTTNSPLANVNVYAPVQLGNGSFTITKIIDLERKFNINLADQVILERALMAMGVDVADSTSIVNSILDWMDRDNMTRVGGAEKDHYQGYDPPYFAKNGPIDDISELLFIRGVTPELYWGPTHAEHSLAAFQARARRFGFEGQATSTVGLVDIFTALSSGKININTASAEVLQLIPGVDNNLAQAIVAGRAEAFDPVGGGLAGPYRSVDDVRRLPEMPLPLVGQLRQFCDVRSRTFEVQVEAEVGGYRRQFVAVVGRNNLRDVQVLSFYSR